MVRRIVALLIVAFVGAGLYGISDFSSGLSANGSSLSSSTFRSELSAISTSATLRCYLLTLNPTSIVSGAGNGTMAASVAAEWSNLRVEGLAIDRYVRTELKYHPNAQALALAKSSLEGEMTQAMTANNLNCPGTSSQALAAMPSEMRSSELEAQASSLYLVSKLNTTIPLTTASMMAYYDSHRSQYDTLCVSVALIPTGEISAFTSAQASGLSVATLAKQFSLDPSKTRGGAYGCYAPTSNVYASVRSDVGTTALNTFPSTPLSTSQNGQTYALYVAPTKRTTTPFSQAEAMVLSDLRTLNATSANTVKQDILYRAAIAVDPAFGRWGLATSGPQVFAPAVPSANAVSAASTLSSANSSSYK